MRGVVRDVQERPGRLHRKVDGQGIERLDAALEDAHDLDVDRVYGVLSIRGQQRDLVAHLQLQLLREADAEGYAGVLARLCRSASEILDGRVGPRVDLGLDAGRRAGDGRLPVREEPEELEALRHVDDAWYPGQLLLQLDEVVDAVPLRVERREIAVARPRDLNVAQPGMNHVFTELLEDSIDQPVEEHERHRTEHDAGQGERRPPPVAADAPPRDPGIQGELTDRHTLPLCTSR